MVKKTGLDPRLLELLVCPVTKEPLDYDEDAQELVSKAAGLAFPAFARARPRLELGRAHPMGGGDIARAPIKTRRVGRRAREPSARAP